MSIEAQRPFWRPGEPGLFDAAGKAVLGAIISAGVRAAVGL